MINNGGGGPNYFPNSFGGPRPVPAGRSSHNDTVTGDVERVETGDEDNFSQCGDFYRNVLDDGGRERLTDNIAGHMAAAQPFIRERAIANFAAADVEYGRKIREKIAVILRNRPDLASRPARPTASLNPPRTIPAKTARCPYGFSSKL